MNPNSATVAPGQTNSNEPRRANTTFARLSVFCADIKIAHSVFALPFALLATFLAAKGLPRVGELLLILICMVAARTVAMASNRLLDAQIDRRNPRTARRAIPSGALSTKFYRAMLIACSIGFIAATSAFGLLYRNWLPLILAVPVLLFLAAYPFLKRFTRLCHYYLGASLALAPLCAWIAIKGNVQIEPLLMAGAVLCWTAGFDIIYACQDFQTDVNEGLFSVPAKLGIGPALWVSRLTHVVSLALLIALGLYSPPLATLYFIGVALCAALLIVEHSIVSPTDLSRVGLAFFTINGIISCVLGTLGVIDVFV